MHIGIPLPIIITNPVGYPGVAEHEESREDEQGPDGGHVQVVEAQVVYSRLAQKGPVFHVLA